MSGHPPTRSRATSTIGFAVVYGALAVLAVVAISLTVLALSPRHEPGALAAPPSTIGAADITNAVFIGDSITQGIGASGPEARWVTLVSVEHDWEPVNLGRSGSGYATAGEIAGCGPAKCPSFVDMVPLAVAAHPGVVFVSGGQSDLSTFASDPAAVTAAIDKTYDSLHADLPRVPIYAVGPSTTGDVTKQLVALDAAVQSAAQRVGATYISLINPNVIKPTLVAADGAHLNDAGYAAMAARINAAIKP